MLALKMEKERPQAKGCRQPQKLEKTKKQILPWSLRKDQSLPTPGF